MDLVCAVHFFISLIIIIAVDCATGSSCYSGNAVSLHVTTSMRRSYALVFAILCSRFCNTILVSPPALLLALINFDELWNFRQLVYHIFSTSLPTHLTFFLCATQSTKFMLPCARSLTAMRFVDYKKNTAFSLPIDETEVQFPFKYQK